MHRHMIYIEFCEKHYSLKENSRIFWQQSGTNQKSVTLWFRSNIATFTENMQEHIVAHLRKKARNLKVSDCSFKFASAEADDIVEVHWERLEIDHEFRPDPDERCIAQFVTDATHYDHQWVCEESDSRKAAGVVSAGKGVQS